MKAARYLFVVTLLFLIAGARLNAAPISGTIGFGGTVSLDTSSAGNATQVVGWHFVGNTGSPIVSFASGDFASTVGMSAAFAAPWTFNMPSGPTIPSFWSVGSFTFDLMTSVIVSQGYTNGNGYVSVTGTGVFHGAGFDDTPGLWSFTTQDPPAGGVFSFSASDAVPEPSTTALITAGAMLVGVALRIRSRKGRLAQ